MLVYVTLGRVWMEVGDGGGLELPREKEKGEEGRGGGGEGEERGKRRGGVDHSRGGGGGKRNAAAQISMNIKANEFCLQIMLQQRHVPSCSNPGGGGFKA